MLNRLVNLILAANNFSGALPMEMKNLTSLKVLNISNNGNLNGSFPGEIVKAMVDLEVLDAYNKDFTGTLPLEIPELKKHKHLSLGGNFFNGEIPDSYGDIQSLEYLGLNRAGLSGKSPAFPSRLEILDMASCTLTVEIPTSLSNLKHLHVSSCQQLNRSYTTGAFRFSQLEISRFINQPVNRRNSSKLHRSRKHHSDQSLQEQTLRTNTRHHRRFTKARSL